MIDAVTHCSQSLYRLGFTNEPCGNGCFDVKSKIKENANMYCEEYSR